MRNSASEFCPKWKTSVTSGHDNAMSLLRIKVNQLLMLIAMGLGGFYLIYRVLYTFNPHQLIFSTIFYLAEFHGFVAMCLFFLDMWSPVRPKPSPAPPGLSVDVFIPTYNENVELLRKTVLGAISMTYPHKTYVLDDGNRPVVKAMAEELGAEYIARATHEHAKAGNINHALRQTQGDYVAIFDADHVPQPEFLDKTLGFFKDPKMAFVQTPQFFYNLNAFEEYSNLDTNDHWELQSMFFHYIQPGKQRWNSAFFCGTCATIRRKALEEVGGIAVETITEDIHTSVLIHARGWKSVYLDLHLATGLAATDVVSFYKQRTRWSLGNMRVLFICNPLFRKGLTLAQRLSYFNAMFAWTVGFQKVVYYLTPGLLLLTTLMPIENFFAKLVMLYMANIIVQLGVYKFITNGQGRVFADELFNMLNFWLLIKAFLRALLGLGQKFVVTRKSGGSDPIPRRVVLPQTMIFLLSFTALGWWLLKLWYDINMDRLSQGLAAFFASYIMLLALTAMVRALTRYDVRSETRHHAMIPVFYNLPSDHELSDHMAYTFDYNAQGMALIGFQPLPMQQEFDATILLPSMRVLVKCKALYMRKNTSNGAQDTYYYGIHFTEVAPEYTDALNMQIMQQSVPEMVQRIYAPVHSLAQFIRGFLPFRFKRNPIWLNLPVNLDPRPGVWSGARLVGLEERNAVLAVNQPPELQKKMDVVLLSPVGLIRGALRVTGSRESAMGPNIWEWLVFFEDLDFESTRRLERLQRRR